MAAGLDLSEAAKWVGQSCWAELRLHEVLTAWMADEPDAAFVEIMWGVRADAAERAAAWHRRLPELREFPRAGFVAAPGTDQEAAWDLLAGAPDLSPRTAGLRLALSARADEYKRHRGVAVGPADGPVAATLVTALASVQRGLESLATSS